MVSRLTSTRQSALALIGLLVVAAVWGSSFPLTKQLLARIGAVDFLAVRFALAAVVMVLVFQRALRALDRRAVIRGSILGALYGVAQIVQTSGLAHTSASVSGFITGTYVVLTPVCAAVLLKTRITARWWAGAVLALIGLGVMALNGFAVGFGEGITLFSALLFALHIVGLSAWSTGRDALGLSVVQIVACGVVCLAAALPGGMELPAETGDWWAIVYMALVSGALAMIVQSWAQAHLAASRAAIIMSSEPVWAAGFAITFTGEPLTWRIGFGGVLMVIAMLVVELGPQERPDHPRPEELPKLAA